MFVAWSGLLSWVQITNVGRSLYIGSFCPAMTSLSRCLEEAAFSISIFSSVLIFLWLFSRCNEEMKTIEETMSIIHLENNHRKINTLEKIEILKAASSKHLLNDIIAGQNGPIYKLLPTSVIWNPRSTVQAKEQTKFWKSTITIICDLNSNCQLPKPGDRIKLQHPQDLLIMLL